MQLQAARRIDITNHNHRYTTATAPWVLAIHARCEITTMKVA